jgi:hypothetical protein
MFACCLPYALAQPVTEPVYRVANQAEGAEASADANRTAALDLVAKPGEHPLSPCLRIAKQAQARFENEIKDYSCTFSKQEVIDGRMGEPQRMYLRVAHEPFSVYMKFVKPFAGREVLYVAGQNNNKLVALSDGWKRNFGKVYLDPEGSTAMDGQRHPITKAGLKNLTAELIKIMEADMKYAECEVKCYPEVKIDNRPTTMIQATHPVPRDVFKFHIARIYIDNEYKVPTAFEAYTWPQKEGGKPLLMEKYIFTDLKLNNGYTEADFSVENPEIFR